MWRMNKVLGVEKKILKGRMECSGHCHLEDYHLEDGVSWLCPAQEICLCDNRTHFNIVKTVICLNHFLNSVTQQMHIGLS